MESQPIESLFDFNIKKNPGAVIRRSTIEYHADRDRYAPGETIILEFNTKSNHLYGPNCRLEGSFTVISADDITTSFDTLGHNLAATMFKNIRLSWSGYEVVNELEVGQRIDAADIMSCDRDYFDSEGESMGYHEDRLGNGLNSRFSQGGFVQDFSIPMHHILGFFGQTNFIPTGLVKKELRLEFKLKSLADMITWVNLPVDGVVNIDTVRLVTDQYTLSPEIEASIQKVCKTTGINYTFDTWSSRRFRTTSQGNQTFQMTEFVNRALGFMFRVSSDLILNEPRTDNLLVNVYSDTIVDWRVKLGKSFYPANFNVSDVTFAYNETLKAFNNLSDCTRPPVLSLNEYQNGRHVVSVDFERSITDEEGSSATPTILSNNLELDINLGDPSGTVWVIFAYLHYQKAIKLLNNQVLDSR